MATRIGDEIEARALWFIVHDTSVRLGETALIIGDPALRVRMSAAATRRVSRLLRWEHTVTDFEKVLKTVAETGKSGRR
jgi:hypothetical protein